MRAIFMASSSGVVELTASGPANRHCLPRVGRFRYMEPMHPTILFQDQRFVVIDKPAGLPVHPGPSGGRSVEDWFGVLSRRKEGPWLAHRLDADTAGCLVIALRRAPLLAAQALFACRRRAQNILGGGSGNGLGRSWHDHRTVAPGDRPERLAHDRGRAIRPSKQHGLEGSWPDHCDDLAGTDATHGANASGPRALRHAGCAHRWRRAVPGRGRRPASAGTGNSSAARPAGRCCGGTAGAYACRAGAMRIPGFAVRRGGGPRVVGARLLRRSAARTEAGSAGRNDRRPPWRQ